MQPLAGTIGCQARAAVSFNGVCTASGANAAAVGKMSFVEVRTELQTCGWKKRQVRLIWVVWV